MKTIKMWVARESESSPPISIRQKHELAEADAKRLGVQKFEVVQVWVSIETVALKDLCGEKPGGD